MSIYLTEDEQVEAIKAWFKRNYQVISVLLSVILIFFSLYRYYTWHQDKVQQEASSTYENLMLSVSNHSNKSVKAYANQLIQNYPNTVYADVARLTLAKLVVAVDKYPRAITYLDEVITKSKVSVLKEIAIIRKARLLMAQHDYAKAIVVLDSMDDATYSSIQDELKGDIYFATGRKQDALVFYKKANSASQKQGINNSLLDMKAKAV